MKGAAAVGTRGLLPEWKALWCGRAPGAIGDCDTDTPAVSVYPTPRAFRPSAAMVICPGGAYRTLAEHEGRDYALFLAKHGVTGVVLRYRLGTAGYRHPAMLLDAARAIRWTRLNASGLGVDPDRVGIMGSSAGGHLASTLLTRFDAGVAGADDPVERLSSRPDLGVLCYPVITMGTFTHEGSKAHLLGDSPDPRLVVELSNETKVTAGTPPCFLWHTVEDTAVPVENSTQFAAALRRAGVAFELHLYSSGRHGLGLAAEPPDFEGLHPWANNLVHWLKERGFVNR